MTLLAIHSPVDPLVEPCERCGTGAGYRRSGAFHPTRYDGTRHGFAGRLCHDCFFALNAAARVEADGEPVPPCCLCGDRGGSNCRRVPGTPYGLEGDLCLCCRDDLQAEAAAARRGVKAIERAARGFVATAELVRREREASRLYRRKIAGRICAARAVKIRDESGLTLRQAWRISRLMGAFA